MKDIIWRRYPQLAPGLALIVLLSGCGREGLFGGGRESTLEVRVEGTGAIAGPDGLRCTDACTWRFPRGTHVTLRAQPDGGTELGGWSTDCAGTEQTCDLHMDRDRTAGALFGFRLTVEPSGSGAGVVYSEAPTINCGETCTGVVVPGTELTLTAQPEPGSTLRTFSGGGCAGSPCTLTVTKHEIVSALFYGGAPLAVQSFGGAGDDVGYSAAVDDAGEATVVGSFEGTVDFGGTELTSLGGSDQLLLSFDAGGQLTFADNGGDTGDDALLGVSMIDGDLYVAGYFTDPGFGDFDAVVARVTPDGSTWSGNVVTGGNDFAMAVIPFGAAQVLVVGQVSGTPTSNVDVLVTQYARDGGAEGTRSAFGSSAETDTAYAGASDADGNAYVVGSYTGAAAFGGASPLDPQGGSDGFVAKYDSARDFEWAIPIAGPGDDAVYAVVPIGSDALVAGTFSGSVDFGGESHTAIGGRDGFVARYDAEGALVWVVPFGSDGDDEVFAATLSNDELVVTGYVSGPVDLGDGALPYVAGADLFTARFAADGRHLWSYTYGGDGDDVGYALAVRPDGHLLVTGSYQSEADFSVKSISSAGGTDLVLLESAP